MTRLALVGALALTGCYAQSTSTFHHTDKRFHLHEKTDSVEIFLETPPAQAYRVVGTIKVNYIRDEAQAPLLAAERARLVGCDLITTHLTGARVGQAHTPRVLLASWGSGSSGGSSGGWSGGSSGGGSWGRSSGGGGGDGSSGTTTTTTTKPLYSSHSYYCGIYITPSEPTAATLTPTVASRH
jgi:uncharacterized membrane protein YgcG